MYRLTARGIMVEGKVDIVKRLGRSPDRADAVVYAAHRSLISANVTPVRVVGGINKIGK